MSHPKPLALIILDGMGLSEEEEGNAVYQAETPMINSGCEKYPHTVMGGSGEDVGLPEGQMGNSEVGHLNLGAGRIVYQDYTRINKAVEKETLEDNAEIMKSIEHAKRKQ